MLNVVFYFCGVKTKSWFSRSIGLEDNEFAHDTNLGEAEDTSSWHTLTGPTQTRISQGERIDKN